MLTSRTFIVIACLLPRTSTLRSRHKAPGLSSLFLHKGFDLGQHISRLHIVRVECCHKVPGGLQGSFVAKNKDCGLMRLQPRRGAPWGCSVGREKNVHALTGFALKRRRDADDRMMVVR